MLSDSTKYPAQIEQLGAVEVQRLYRCSAYCSPSDNEQEVFTPRKVLSPPLTARIEKWDYTFRLGIASVSSIPFVAVTSTGEG
jgi:hypothetical protein